jgi:hypothetical protein
MRTIFLVNEVLKRKELEIVAVSDVSQHSMDQICSIYDKKWDKYLIPSLETGKQLKGGSKAGTETIKIGLTAHQSIREGNFIELQ